MSDYTNMLEDKSILNQLWVFLLTSIFILITSIILIINTWSRVHEFDEYSQTLERSIVHGAAEAIKTRLLNKQRHTRLFVDEYAQLLDHLQKAPNDTRTLNDIHTRLKQRFEDFFTFTITDPQGNPLLDELDFFVGEACREDLKGFSQSLTGYRNFLHNQIFIHPQPQNYHYDVMVPLRGENQSRNVFFVSFYPQAIATILRNHQMPGVELMLVRQSNPDLIEITGEGSRDQLSREIKLTDRENATVHIYENIKGTDWRVISLSNSEYHDKYVRNLWKEAIIIMLVVLLAMIVLVFTMVKLPPRYYID